MNAPSTASRRSAGRYLLAELKCYGCRRVAGEIAGPMTAPGTASRRAPLYMRGAGGAWRPATAAERRRCPHCGGPLGLDEVEYLRVRRGAAPPWAAASAAPEAARVPGSAA